MTVNYTALASTFTYTPVDRAREQRHLNAYYCLRQLLWKASTGRLFRQAIEMGALTPVAPGRRGPDGQWMRPEYDEAEIQEMFSNAREEFNNQFDEAFNQATTAELFAAAKKFFAIDKQGFITAITDYVADREARGQ